MNLIEIMADMQKRKTIRELRTLMERLRAAIKEGEKHESKPDEDGKTSGDHESPDYHTTA